MGRLTITRYYRASAIALHGLAAVLLATSGAVEPGFLVLVLLVGALFGLLRVGPVLQRSLGALLVGAGVLVGVLSFQRARDILFLFTHPLLSLLPLFLPPLREPGRHWRALLVSFLLAVVSLISGAELAEYVLFFFYCLVLIFHLNAAFLFQSMGRVDSARTAVPPRYFPPFLAAIGGGTLFALLLFVLFPRSIQWSNPLGLRSRETVTGYTGEVALEGASPRESSALALTIESSDLRWLSRTGPWLFMRGNTLDRFDGTRWSNSFPHTKPLLHPKSLRYTELVDKIPRDVRVFRELHLPQTVVYPGVLAAIVAPGQLLKGLREDGAGNLTRGAIGPLRYSYQATVLIPRTDTAPAARLSDYGELRRLAHAEAYLQLPLGLGDERWFRRWADSVPVPPGEDVPVGVILGALERNFRSRFQAVSRSESLVENSLESFLGKTRVGHCEYFASAAALFLRSRKIPARLALGYRGGSFNSVSGVLEVRESNAHAWVEVWVPGEGWRTFDPTPIGITLEAVTIWEHAKSYLSAARFWFDRYLVDYNSQTQKELMRDLASIRSPSGQPAGILGSRGAIAIVVFAVMAWLGRRWRWRGTRRWPTRSGLPGYYVTFQRKMRRRGHARRPTETYAAFHARLIQAKEPHELVAAVDACLDRDLYAKEPMTDRERREITRQVRAFG